MLKEKQHEFGENEVSKEKQKKTSVVKKKQNKEEISI
jgi:hypothetical protein